MIRRMDDAPKLINPSGYISEGQPAKMPEKEGPPATPDSLPRGEERQLGAQEVEEMAQAVSEETDVELSRELSNKELESDTSEDSIGPSK